MRKIVRVPHVIRKNKRNNIYKNVVFVDTETKTKHDNNGNDVQEFMLGVAKFIRYDDDLQDFSVTSVLHFDNIDNFWRWLFKLVYMHKNIHIYAHNMDFDFEILRAYRVLYDRGWDLNFFVISSSAFMFSYSYGNYTLRFSDTMQYFQGSVRNLGKKVGLQKLEMPSYSDTRDKWFEYCERDVDIILRMYVEYIKFIRAHNLGNQAETVAGQAFNAFRHRFMKHKIKIHTFPDVTSDEIESYHGGRTEPFYIGRVNENVIYDLDVNSIYPYVMKKYEYPTEYLTTYETPSIDMIKKLLQSYCVLARVDIRANEPVFPLKLDKLIFPVGNFTTLLSTGELKYAVDHGMVTKVHYIRVYKKARIFEDYVNYFYKLKQKAKQDGDSIQYAIIKLFLNSLYGKFGQRVPHVKPIEYPFALDFGYIFETDTVSHNSSVIIFLNGNAYTNEGREIAQDAFITIAAHVTAYARMYLWKLIKQAGRENVYYCDTDSLFVNERGYDNLKNLLHDSKLGYLKVERVIHDLTIYGSKDYIYDNNRKIKGIPQKAVEIGDGLYEFVKFERMRTRLRKGIEGVVPTPKAIRKESRNYDKAIVTSTGWCEPIRLG